MSLDQLEIILGRFQAVTSKWTPETTLPEMRETFDAIFLEYDTWPGTTISFVTEPVRAEWVTAPSVDPRHAVLLLHGGGYIMGSARAHRAYASWLSGTVGARVFTLDYRLAPEAPFPAALDDARAAYRFLLAEGFEPGSIAVCGDSAGGGLALALLVALRDAKLPLPASAILLSPWADLACAGESYGARAERDPIATPEAAGMMAQSYLGTGIDPRTSAASPVYAQLHGLPPLLVLSGDREIFFDDSRLLVSLVQAAGGVIDWRIWPGMIHQFPIHVGVLAESEEALAMIAAFAQNHWDRTSSPGFSTMPVPFRTDRH